MTASATTATAMRVTGRRQSAGCSPEISRVLRGSVKALEKSSAVFHRSVGDLASARATAFYSHAGTPSRVSRSGGAFAANRREMITWAVGPTNGGIPATISYSTQPRE